MKNKNLIIGGVAVLILYFLYKKKSKQTVEQPKENQKTYFKSDDGSIRECPPNLVGGTFENPTAVCEIK